MKKVLVVDDEADMLWMLQRNLNKGMEGVEILATESGEGALSILSDQAIDLVITDINMPGMSGLDLLVEISNRYPQTGVIIMTAYPSNTYENQAMKSGSLRFVEKPFDINDMRKIVKDNLFSDEGLEINVDGVDLMDIVQFNGLSRSTAALKISTNDREGMIFFKSGEVVHAMCESESGENAFFKILAFQGGSLQNIRGVEPPVITIKKGLESLLLEAANRSNEIAPEKAAKAAATSEIKDLDFDFLERDTDTEQAQKPEDTTISDVQIVPEIETEPDVEIESAEEVAVESAVEPNKDGVPVSEFEPGVDDIAPQSDLSSDEDPAAEPDSYIAPTPEIPTATETLPAALDEEKTQHDEEEFKMTKIQEILAEFTNIDGVHTACLVGRDGFLLDNLARPGIDAEMIGAIASSGFGSAESMGNQLGQGNLNMTMFEYENGPVMFAPVGVEAFLVIVADQDTNLGWIRIAIKKNSKKIAEAAEL